MLLALLIAAAGLIGVGVIVLNRTSGALQQDKASTQQLVRLEKTLRAHAYRTGKLICPAHGDGDGAAKTSCTGNNNDGVVPWRTLGLPREDAQDAAGGMISYSVDPDLLAGDFCAGGGTALPGGIRLAPSVATSLFTLVSHGPTGFGAWLPGGRQAANPASAVERENCADSAADTGRVTCADPNPRVINQGPYQSDPAAAGFFDDITLAAKSADYDAVCAASGNSKPRGAQVSFADIIGDAPAGVEGRLNDSDPFIGANGRDAPRVTVGAGDTPVQVKIGVQSGMGSLEASACIFLKTPLALRVAGAGRVLRNYVEFAFRTDETSDGSRGEGLMLAFVPTSRDSGPPRYNDTLPICGGAGKKIGFQTGPSSNFPDSKKFGVEIDTHSNADGRFAAIADPVNNHLAIDRNRVEHQNDAGPKCVATAPGSLSAPPTGCAAHPTSRDWLEAGQTMFHQLRVEVHASGAAILPSECAPGETAILAWLFESGAQCTDNCDDLRANYTNSGRRAAAFVKHCLPVPNDDVRIGLTTGFDRLSSEPVLRYFGTGSYTSP